MRRLIFILSLSLSGCAGIGPAAPDKIVLVDAPRLEQVWQADGFTNPEGAALAPDGNYFISNVAGEGDVKDAAGWISKVSVSGDVLAMRWAEGIDSPKGMAVFEGHLYVADIDRVHVLDANTGNALKVIDIPGSSFLNDMTTWDGAVYVSDSRHARIYKIVDDKAELWLEDPMLSGVNGLLGDGERLLVVTMSQGALLEVSRDKQLVVLSEGLLNADGLGILSDGTYLVSSWPGQVYHVTGAGTVTTLMDTEAAGILQNDLTMIGETVIIPNFEPGTVTAWKPVQD